LKNPTYHEEEKSRSINSLTLIINRFHTTAITLPIVYLNLAHRKTVLVMYTPIHVYSNWSLLNISSS